MGMAIDAETRRPVIGAVRAGLSGPAIKPLALHLVYRVYEVAAPHGVPIIGQGGIASAEDAAEFPARGGECGGDRDRPLLQIRVVCRKVNAGLADWLTRQGAGGVPEMVGRAHTAGAAVGAGPDPDGERRIQAGMRAASPTTAVA